MNFKDATPAGSGGHGALLEIRGERGHLILMLTVSRPCWVEESQASLLPVDTPRSLGLGPRMSRPLLHRSAASDGFAQVPRSSPLTLQVFAQAAFYYLSLTPAHLLPQPEFFHLAVNFNSILLAPAVRHACTSTAPAVQPRGLALRTIIQAARACRVGACDTLFTSARQERWSRQIGIRELVHYTSPPPILALSATPLVVLLLRAPRQVGLAIVRELHDLTLGLFSLGATLLPACATTFFALFFPMQCLLRRIPSEWCLLQAFIDSLTPRANGACLLFLLPCARLSHPVESF